MELEDTEIVVACELCNSKTPNFNRHMRTHHPGCGGSCGQQGYRSNGTYVEGWHGVCGTGNPYYLLCSACRDRYLAENRAMSDSADCASRNIPYAKLLLMAPDLLGSTEKTEQGV